MNIKITTQNKRYSAGKIEDALKSSKILKISKDKINDIEVEFKTEFPFMIVFSNLFQERINTKKLTLIVFHIIFATQTNWCNY